ncbi:RICIN domain-containing protein [Stigmatella aurantiaca]|uniref:Alpha-glucosidase n=1 Tax=Stigmatella aurantiaca (strain DW4/3-1) TaxID=378806 RepID=Q093X5_STIAD|nr:RICIN domain-containing protein [Stigmatella aurantiaca]ADO69765.1 uncharacterized protein STAUR_1961 [Stigmatella aurantiaca DW4/3-1]EAU67025.1 alpha-glucosidase [Stigmatella aurantiaca DW4/3-1]
MKKSNLMKLMALCSLVHFGALFGFASDAHADIQNDPNAIYKIVNVNSGKVLDVVRNSTEASYRLHQWEYLGLSSQHWKLWAIGNNYYYLVNQNSGLALEPAARNNGAKIWQWPLAFSVQQQWHIGFAPNTGAPPYVIKNNLTLKYIDVEFNGTGNGAYVHQWDYVQGVQSQLWRFERVN